MSAPCDQLAPFVDGELSAPEADAFREHLATCESCARELHDEMMLVALESVHEPPRGSTGRGGKVTPIRAAPRWVSRSLAPVTLAAAAAVALWMARSPHDPGAIATADAPVPEYSLVVNGGDQVTRSGEEPASGGRVVFRRDSGIELVLRPTKPAVGPVTARGFLVQGADARVWNPSLEISSDGAIRAAGRAGELLNVPTGAWDVVLVVGRAGALPSDPQIVLRAMADHTTHRPWQLLVTPVRLVDKPSL